MKKYVRVILLSSVVLCWVHPSTAQENVMTADSCLHQDLLRAEAYLVSFKNDSAAIIAAELIRQLSQTGQLDSPFGLRVQLAYGTALEKDQQDDEAILRLLAVKEKSEQQALWTVHTKACLILANLYEKLGREKATWQHLLQARKSIIQYRQDQLYPRYAVRTASYYRVFQNNIDSAIYYAEEALRTAPLYQLKLEAAIGHLLMGILLSDTDYPKAVQHFKAAGEGYQAIEDHTGYSYINHGIANLHFRHGHYNQALAYNDTLLLAAQRAIAEGNQRHTGIARAYRFRGEIYQALGQQDSAWHYLKKGYRMELDYVRESTAAEVVEIDARYHDEKKMRQIEEQEQVIRRERYRRKWVMRLGGVIFCFALILIYYALRLRQANRNTREQALALSQANEDLSGALRQQILLQGEIHHRVKNNLQVIISLLELQKEDITDPAARESLEAMSGRIYSMAAIHQVLYLQEDAQLVDLLEYARKLCQYFKDFSRQQDRPVFQLDIPPQHFNLETLMPLGIILNELLTNSLKYAAGLGHRLIVGIRLQVQPDGYCLHYRDNGPGFPQGRLQDREGGLGSYLLRSMSRQLNGRMESTNDRGAVCRIYFKEKNTATDYQIG